MSESQRAPQEYAGLIAEGKDWREIVALVGDLPPMPHVASRAIGMVENAATTASELSELLSSDTALAARVLKIANSAMFSRQREITTLNQAVMLIGFKALKGIIVAATLRQLNKSFGPVEKLVWEHSMSVAMGATAITKRLKRRYVDEIFLLGLLHSLGQIALLHQIPAEYKKTLKVIEEKHVDYSEAEQALLGFTHPLIGALVAKKWNFSAETCQVILHYRDPIDGAKPDGDLEEKTAIVQLADLVAHAAGIGCPPGYPPTIEQMKAVAKYLGFEAATIEATVEDLVNATQELFAKESGIYA